MTGWPLPSGAPPQQGIVVQFLLVLEVVIGWHPIDRAVFQEVSQHLQKVRFTRPKEAGDPNPVGRRVVVVGIEEDRQTFRDFACDDIFVQFDLQARLIVGLDHAINRTINRLEEYLTHTQGHDSNLVVHNVEGAVIAVIMR